MEKSILSPTHTHTHIQNKNTTNIIRISKKRRIKHKLQSKLEEKPRVEVTQGIEGTVE